MAERTQNEKTLITPFRNWRPGNPTKSLVLLFALQSLLLTASSAAGDPALFPTLEGETLLGNSFSIPRDFQGRPTWMIIGFTKDSQKATSLCSEKLDPVFKNQGYSIAILQGVPFFIKGIIKNSIRTSVPDSRRERYLILSEGRDQLERLAEFSDKSKDDAYILGIRSRPSNDYEVTFKSNGSCDEPHLSFITKMILDLTQKK